MAATYVAMIESGFDLNLLVYDFPRADRTDDVAWQCGEDAVLAARAQTGSRIAVVSSLPENMPEARGETLIKSGIAPMMGLEECLTAAAASANVYQGWNSPPAAPVILPTTHAKGDSIVLDEAASKAALASHGLCVPPSRTAKTTDGAAQAATAIGFPVVLKGLGVAHKTEAGAVKLGLSSATDVQTSAMLMQNAQGFLIEGMIEDSVTELIVGAVRDPVYGFALTIGAGGILTELLEDSITLLAPAFEADIQRALSKLKVYRILSGYRGKPAADIEVLVAAIMAIQGFVAAESHRLEELDVNPLIVTPTEVIAADALIRFRT
jgi:acyl-CoA synthetase (NDP forming)